LIAAAQGGVDQFLRVADNPDVEPGLAELALTQPNACADSCPAAEHVITDAGKVRDALGTVLA
jgi:hypothetical protein